MHGCINHDIIVGPLLRAIYEVILLSIEYTEKNSTLAGFVSYVKHYILTQFHLFGVFSKLNYLIPKSPYQTLSNGKRTLTKLA